MKLIKTIFSTILFILSALAIAVIYGFFGAAAYYLIGLSMYLVIFLIPSIIYEINENRKIPLILILLLWLFSIIALFVYANIQGVGGSASISSQTHQPSSLEYVNALLVVSFPYFVYVITFLTQYKLWKEILWGCIGYVLLFISAAFI